MRSRRAAKERCADPEPAGTYAVHAIGKVDDESHATALALIDELIAMGPVAHVEPMSVAGEVPVPR